MPGLPLDFDPSPQLVVELIPIGVAEPAPIGVAGPWVLGPDFRFLISIATVLLLPTMRFEQGGCRPYSVWNNTHWPSDCLSHNEDTALADGLGVWVL